MGNNLDCLGIECEEEVIQRVLSSLPLNDLPVNDAYDKFIQCINTEDLTLDYFKYNDYLLAVIGENKFKQAQYDFFQNLRRHSEDAIGIIGTEIIFLSKGAKEEKISKLTEHYSKYYKSMHREITQNFIQNIIELNTDTCIYSFNSSFGIESSKRMREIYSLTRQKKFNKVIMLNYDSLFEKIYKTSTPNPDQLCFLTVDQGDNMDKLDRFAKEFMELTYSYLCGEFIRTWLYDEFIKDRPKSDYSIC